MREGGARVVLIMGCYRGCLGAKGWRHLSNGRSQSVEWLEHDYPWAVSSDVAILDSLCCTCVTVLALDHRLRQVKGLGVARSKTKVRSQEWQLGNGSVDSLAITTSINVMPLTRTASRVATTDQGMPT